MGRLLERWEELEKGKESRKMDSVLPSQRIETLALVFLCSPFMKMRYQHFSTIFHKKFNFYS
jgi:hypothetical protein